MTDSIRIAYRGNFRLPFCTEVHVAQSLEALGHTVIRLQENETTWPRCVETAKSCHMFLWTKTWIIDPEGGARALDELRSAGIPTVSFHLDRYVGLEREAQIVEDPFWRTQFVFTADGGHDAEFAAYGVNHHWLPPGMYDGEATIGRPSLRRFREPVVFVGSYPYPHPDWADYRRDLIETVRARFGRDFAVWPKPGQPIRNRDLSDLYASARVVVGDSCLAGGATHYWSDRVPETLGRGALLIHPAVEGMQYWYSDGEDLLTYELGDFGKVVELCEWALANPDEAALIAKRGQATVLARDTYKHRLAEVIGVVGGQHGFPDAPEVIERVTARHRRVPRPTTFAVRGGHPTDAQVIAEVWKADQYGVEPADVAGKTVVDVGANIGAFSVLAASMRAARVVAFEPEPANARILRLNAAGAPKIEIREEALGAADAELILAPGPGGVHGGGSHALLPEELEARAAAEDPQNVVVPLRHAGAALAEIGPVGLLKLDCEGSEYAICSVLDFTQIERIVGEWHGPVMPHLADRWSSDDQFLRIWGAWAAMLADYGRVEFYGHPRAGGIFRWARY
jgi:FkbM family methyltransferase